jgi:hypothetical protein
MYCSSAKSHAENKAEALAELVIEEMYEPAASNCFELNRDFAFSTCKNGGIIVRVACP